MKHASKQRGTDLCLDLQGKTTLIDRVLEAAGPSLGGGERAMDNLDQVLPSRLAFLSFCASTCAD